MNGPLLAQLNPVNPQLIVAKQRSAQKMATIFTRAKAAKKAIDLIDLECGILRSRLRCDSRLESDLGIVGDDTYALLEAMHENGVDMSRFDCHDRITPEGQDAVPMLIYFGIFTACVFVFFVMFPDLSPWLIVPVSLAGAYFALGWIYRFLPDRGHDELRVRDLVLSFEAGHWISPKVQNKTVVDNRLPAPSRNDLLDFNP